MDELIKQDYDSAFEQEVADILYSNFINYKSHVLVCKYRKWTCDFYLPDYDLWVEVDGSEDCRRQPELMQEKLDYYNQFDYNYAVVTKKDDVLSKLNLKLEHNYTFDYREIDKSTSDSFLERVHYLKRGARSDSYRLGVFFQKILVGLVTFGRIANPNEKSLCLTRCAILDRIRLPYPFNNVTSHIISRSLRWLKKNGYKGKVVSWSDPRFHNGVLYKACNFSLVDNNMRKDYIYVDEHGQEFHKSKCRVKAGESQKKKASELGLKKLVVPPKQRWEITIA